jgi:hypothetical protein
LEMKRAHGSDARQCMRSDALMRISAACWLKAGAAAMDHSMHCVTVVTASLSLNARVPQAYREASRLAAEAEAQLGGGVAREARRGVGVEERRGTSLAGLDVINDAALRATAGWEQVRWQGGRCAGKAAGAPCHRAPRRPAASPPTLIQVRQGRLAASPPRRKALLRAGP